MKKLMIAAAIVCAAAFAQAASCTWTADGEGFAWSYYKDATKGIDVDTYEAGSAGTYWIIALAENSTAGISVDNTGALVMDSSVGRTISADFGGQGTFNVPGERVLAGEVTDGISQLDNGKYFALVIYDSENGLYGVSDTVMMAGIIDNPPNPGDYMRFSNHTGEDFGYEGDTQRWMVADTLATSAVPEPTSGLLLLLGVAGLALRRRRA